MRILKVSQAYFPFLEKGGPAVKVRAIAAGLARNAHQVTVLTADFGLGSRKGQLASMDRFPGGWRAQQDGVEAVYLRNWVTYRNVTLNPGLIRFCLRALRSFQLVHIYGLYDLLGPPVAFFCRRWGIPYVLEPMGMSRPIVRSIPSKRLYRRIFGKALMAGARWIIATSKQEQEELLEDGVPAARICVRRNGVEIPDSLPALGTFRQKWRIPREAKLILFLGRLVSKKSPDLLLQILARWRQESVSQPSVLVLVGPDEGDGYLAQLRTLTRQLGLESQVLFTGPLYDEAKWAAYRDAHVFVLPSQHENFGNSAAEAIACGTPVLLTDRCGIAPFVDGQAGLVVSYDLEALYAGLTRMLRDDNLVGRLRAGCAQVVRALSWEEPVHRMEALYAQMLAGVVNR